MQFRKVVPLVLLGAVILGCSGDFWRSCTSAVVGKTVETTKGVTKGVVDGVEDGRKAGESVDGAFIVTTLEELQAHGSVSVYAVRSNGSGSDVVLTLENTAEQPLRVSAIEVLALDAEGFVKHPARGSSLTLTVPARAKDQLTVAFDVPAENVRTVRVWGADLPVPAPRPADPQ